MKKSFSLIIALVLALVFSGAVFANGGSEPSSDATGSGSLEASLALEDAVLALTAADGQSLIKVSNSHYLAKYNQEMSGIFDLGKKLEGHLAVELEVLGLVHHAHATLAKGFNDPVMRDGLPKH